MKLRVIQGGGTDPKKVIGRRYNRTTGLVIPSPFWDFRVRGWPYLIRFWVLDGGPAGEVQAALWAATGYGPAHHPRLDTKKARRGV